MQRVIKKKKKREIVFRELSAHMRVRFLVRSYTDIFYADIHSHIKTGISKIKSINCAHNYILCNELIHSFVKLMKPESFIHRVDSISLLNIFQTDFIFLFRN